MTWTNLTAAQKADQVRDLVQIRGLTYRQAAKTLGTTINAIAGVVDRNAVESTSGAIGKPRTRQDEPPPSAEETAGRRLLASRAWEPLPGTTPADLDHRTGCKWPIGDRPILYCNEPTDDTGRYCAVHTTMSRSPAWLAQQKKETL